MTPVARAARNARRRAGKDYTPRGPVSDSAGSSEANGGITTRDRVRRADGWLAGTAVLGGGPRMYVHMNTHVVVISESLDFSPSDDDDDVDFVPIEEIYDGSREIAFDHRLSIKDALNFVRRS